MSRVFGYSRSSVYHVKNYVKKTNERRALIIGKMMDIYNMSHGTYGSLRITMALRQEGIIVSRRTIQDYMKRIDIHSISFKRFRYKKSNFKDFEYLKLTNHKLDKNVDDINQIWTQDVTYIKLADGTNAYLASVMDYYSRKVISYELSRSMTTDLILRVLKKAFDTRHPKSGIILHSDKGAQYRSDKYKEFAFHHKAIRSYTRIVFSCADNASQESFHASLKKECLYQMKPKSFEETNEIIFQYIDGFYNVKRLHSTLSYKSPNDFEESLKTTAHKSIIAR